jgi:hypothetical protein
VGLVRGTSYGVVPDALRTNKIAWDQAEDNWEQFANSLRNDVVMGDGDMGLIGRMAGFPSDYNNARETILKTVGNGQRQMQDVAHTLDDVAKTYEEKDAEYYEQFGYQSDDDMTDRRLP